MDSDLPSDVPGNMDASIPAYRLEEQLHFAIRLAKERHTALFSSRMIENLTSPQFATLARLKEVGPCSQSRLGRLVHLDSTTIRSVIDRLRTRGFVFTMDTPGDRAKHVVVLTESGRVVTDAAIKAAHEINRDMLAPLNLKEQGQLMRLLKKLRRP